jgi:hypothetical protein
MLDQRLDPGISGIEEAADKARIGVFVEAEIERRVERGPGSNRGRSPQSTGRRARHAPA